VLGDTEPSCIHVGPGAPRLRVLLFFTAAVVGGFGRYRPGMGLSRVSGGVAGWPARQPKLLLPPLAAPAHWHSRALCHETRLQVNRKCDIEIALVLLPSSGGTLSCSFAISESLRSGHGSQTFNRLNWVIEERSELEGRPKVHYPQPTPERYGRVILGTDMPCIGCGVTRMCLRWLPASA
jgi:hypothetical protein